MTLGELASLIRTPVAQIITYFFAEKGKPMTINDVLEKELIEEVCNHYELEYIFDDEKTTTAGDRGFLAEQQEGDHLEPRPPVVTVMGHVDHGKTTLLDTLRQRSVAATEAGGITQRIGAYTVELDGQQITFIEPWQPWQPWPLKALRTKRDTPGHEAFTAMRARGAQVTDIAVLVVAADDGVMPQTREAIAHARAAEVPIIVAINKIDKDGADAQMTRQKLSEEGLIAEDWGGDVPMVEVSAKKNINLDDELLEILNLTAEISELKAIHKGPAAGVVLESTFDASKGNLATLLVQRGTLKRGDYTVSGTKFGRVRAMENEAGADVPVAGPSTAVQVTGFQESPQAGDQFEVFETAQEATWIMARARAVAERRAKETSRGPLGFAGLSNDSDQTMRLALILKTDAQGSIAAVKHMFSDVKDSKYVNLRWVLTAPGPITDSDVELASTCPEGQRVMILGFNTQVSPSAERTAKERGIEIQNFKVIYELKDTVVAALEGDLNQEEELIEKGIAEIKAVFNGRDGKVAGAEVLEGQFTKGQRVHVIRKGKKVGEGKIRTLRRFKEEVTDVDEGNECGFNLDGFEDFNAGDEARCFEVRLVSPELVKR
ncbi:Translation initiation factor IF-2 [Durusdinium trenchii]|uniref:Translation initiation factor IF-2, chloroplastic n=2 Tax=Durusdinium trenchii TaxID=1381693 RepID=A0ABP0KJ12_9DINO